MKVYVLLGSELDGIHGVFSKKEIAFSEMYSDWVEMSGFDFESSVYYPEEHESPSNMFILLHMDVDKLGTFTSLKVDINSGMIKDYVKLPDTFSELKGIVEGYRRDSKIEEILK